MSATTITLGSNIYTLISMPEFPGFTDVTFDMLDSVSAVESPYVPSQMQTQRFAGADRWSVQLTLPKMTRSVAAPWIAFLAALQGAANVFRVGDPLGATPNGTPKGAPVVDGTVGGNATSSSVLYTRGWTPNLFRLLKPGDYIQVVDRLYMAAQQVNSDANGKAAISVWPSLRETPADATELQLANTQAVFRLASNKRTWHTTVDRLIQISFQAVEAR